MATVATFALIGACFVFASGSDKKQAQTTFLATDDFEDDSYKADGSEEDVLYSQSLLSLASGSLPVTEYAGLKVAFESAAQRG